jgi:hypothetical protein
LISNAIIPLSAVITGRIYIRTLAKFIAILRFAFVLISASSSVTIISLDSIVAYSNGIICAIKHVATKSRTTLIVCLATHSIRILI